MQSSDPFEVVYSPEGVPVSVARLNALDLVRHSGYSWRQEVAAAIEEAPEAVVEALAEVFPEEVPEAEAEAPVDTNTADLDVVAEAVAGTDQLTYLSSFSVEDLKVIAEERYGEKLRANVSKDKAIERIMALEAARIAAESTTD